MWLRLTPQLLTTQVVAFPADKTQSKKPTPAALKAAITHAVKHGCAKGTKVFINGPTNAGKSHILEALITSFGEFAFRRPVGRANNCPLQDLFGKRLSWYRISAHRLTVWTSMDSWCGSKVDGFEFQLLRIMRTCVLNAHMCMGSQRYLLRTQQTLMQTRAHTLTETLMFSQ